MKIYEPFSKRQKRLRGEVPDVYEYEIIPSELRRQVIYIWKDIWGEVRSRAFRGFGCPMHAYESIHKILGRAYGVFRLDNGSDYDEIVLTFLLSTEDTEKVLDVIEVSFRYVDQEVRNQLDVFMSNSRSKGYKNPKISPDEAIDELNYRFREHGVGYQYESGRIMRVDSQFIHSEAVKPTLIVLSNPMYKNANEEFLKAHKLYRERNYKDCVSNCLNALESCLKVICSKRGWKYGERDGVQRLIKIVFDNGLIPPLMQSHFSALRSTLESGVPTIRNNQSGHGQGPEEIIVPEYIASYILHLTASNILLLAKADEEMK